MSITHWVTLTRLWSRSPSSFKGKKVGAKRLSLYLSPQFHAFDLFVPHSAHTIRWCFLPYYIAFSIKPRTPIPHPCQKLQTAYENSNLKKNFKCQSIFFLVFVCSKLSSIKLSPWHCQKSQFRKLMWVYCSNISFQLYDNDLVDVLNQQQ